MPCSRGNPKGQMRRCEPEAMTRRDFHHSPRCVDQLVRVVSVFRNVVSGRIFVGKRGNRNAWLRVVLLQGAVSHNRYIMAQQQSTRQRPFAEILSAYLNDHRETLRRMPLSQCTKNL